MEMEGDLKIHKSDGVTRPANAVKTEISGALAVWDTGSPKDPDNPEPDVLVPEDKWERVERKGHSWKHTSRQAIIEQAEERGDVDEEKVKEQL